MNYLRSHPAFGPTFGPHIDGIPVIVSKTAVSKVWVFPAWRFCTFEPKDEAWCRPLGLGHEETRPAAYMMDGALFCHPTIVEQLKKELPRR